MERTDRTRMGAFLQPDTGGPPGTRRPAPSRTTRLGNPGALAERGRAPRPTIAHPAARRQNTRGSCRGRGFGTRLPGLITVGPLAHTGGLGYRRAGATLIVAAALTIATTMRIAARVREADSEV
jgi:hypothetical protein